MTPSLRCRRIPVAQFLQPFTLNPAKASSDYLGKWVKVRGVIVDIRRKSGIAGSYYFIVTMRDENRIKRINVLPLILARITAQT